MEWKRGEDEIPPFHDLISSLDYEKMSESEPGARPQGMFRHSGSTCPTDIRHHQQNRQRDEKETDQIRFVYRLGLMVLGHG